MPVWGFFFCPTNSHQKLFGAVRVKCDLLFGFHLASWTVVDLITARCVHTNPSPLRRTNNRCKILLCRAIVMQVNLRPGHDINSSAPHRWKMYMFPRPVWVPVANERVGFTPCLTSFRPCLPNLAMRQQELTGCRLINYLSGGLVVRSQGAACLSSEGPLRLDLHWWDCVEGLRVYSDEYVSRWWCIWPNFWSRPSSPGGAPLLPGLIAVECCSNLTLWVPPRVLTPLTLLS